MAGENTQRQYNDPAGDFGAPAKSTIDSAADQMHKFFYEKKALIEARRESYLLKMADVTSMPKHMGKKIKKYHYLPLLDDANINDQGIDASGATIADGNLYGSSKDIGSIPGKLPIVGERGGRVNRVGFKRIDVEGTIQKLGFFDEYTRDSIDFDSDKDLREHVNREMLNGAHEISEDMLQIDLISGAGTVKYVGEATSTAEVGGSTPGDDGTHDLVTYRDLLQLHITLNDNRTPRQTKMFTGTRMIDTRTIAGGRVMFIGSELQPTLEAMIDLHGNQAFIPIHQYAAGLTPMDGEIGTVGHFRIVVHPEMMKFEGAGAADVEPEYYGDTNYDVFPMLVVGDESFTTIGFQTDGKTVKFKILHKPPGDEQADRDDPYGETGFMSIKWWYGFLLQRPERIGLIKTAALL